MNCCWSLGSKFIKEYGFYLRITIFPPTVPIKFFQHVYLSTHPVHSVDLINTLTKSNFEKKWFILIYRLQSIFKRNQGRSLETGNEAKTTEELLMSLLCFLHYTPRVTSSDGTTHSTLNPPTFIASWENAAQACQQANLTEAILPLRSCVPRWL